MCFRFDAWCCFGAVLDHEDDCYGSSAKGGATPDRHAADPANTTTPQYYYPPPQTAQRNGHHGAARHYHQQLPVAAAADGEEYRKASNDAKRGHAPAAGATATKGAHGHAAAVGAQHVYDGTLISHPATDTKEEHYRYH